MNFAGLAEVMSKATGSGDVGDENDSGNSTELCGAALASCRLDKHRHVEKLLRVGDPPATAVKSL